MRTGSRGSLHTFFTASRAEQSVRPDRQRHDHQDEREDVRVGRTQHRRDQRLDDAEHEAGQHDAARAAEPAQDGDGEGLDAEQRAHVGRDREQRRDQDAGDAGEHGRRRVAVRDRTRHVDAHQARCLRVLDDGEQRLAVPRAARERVQSERDADGHDENRDLQRRYRQPAERERFAGNRQRQRARLLAEREHHRLLEDDAGRHGRHQPGVGAGTRERAARRRARSACPTRAHSASAIAIASASGQPSVT